MPLFTDIDTYEILEMQNWLKSTEAVMSYSEAYN
jgi:hypothetical protein